MSANRQAWINDLRQDVSELLGCMGIVTLAADSEGGKVKLKESGPVEFFQRLLVLRQRIALRLNPAEAAHVELLTLIDVTMKGSTSSGAARSEALMEGQPKIVAATQAILKAEWTRVKGGD